MASNDPSRRGKLRESLELLSPHAPPTSLTLTKASVASTTSEMSLLDQANGSKIAPRKDKPNGAIKLKKAIVKNSEAKEGDGSEPKTGGTTRSPTPGSPIPESELGKPIEDRPDHLQCKHCKKPIPKAVALSHVKLCEQKKKEKARRKKEAKEAKAAQAKEKERAEKEKEKEMEVDGYDGTAEASGAGRLDEDGGEPSTTQEGTIKTGKKSAGKASTDGPKQNKKRKADGEGDKEPKKKKLKKDEPPKPKLPKPKGPVDVEKQCGVQLPNGGNCARSLTCKSHSMGAKRAVPGRSMPYDQLLAAYQKKNQAKQQKAALSSLAPLAEDLEPVGPVDSDEETEAVMAGISRSRPKPIAQYTHIDLKRRNEKIRIKQQMTEAMPGKNGRGMFAIGEAQITPWNSDGRYGDFSAAPLRSSSGPISDVRMAQINSGMFENFELPSLDEAANVEGSAVWKLREGHRKLKEQFAAEDEARKNGVPLPPAEKYHRTVGHDGKGLIHIDEN